MTAYGPSVLKEFDQIVCQLDRGETRSLVPAAPFKGEVAFVERKQPCWPRVQQLLNFSRLQNRWANGGPVSIALENAISAKLRLPDDRRVVMCSSGTAALLALASAHNYHTDSRLHWVVSAFGFPSTTVGPLVDASVIDCDERGYIDLEMLGAMDDSCYDGVIATNTFGLHNDWRELIQFCKARGKILIYDNAQALLGCDRWQPDAPDEIVSFHHTKPWGFGEGGCAIVSAELEPTVRSMINIGDGLDSSAREHAFNGKASEVTCAPILERLERIAEWSVMYRVQQRRISSLAAHIGFLPLAPLNEFPRNSVPLLATKPFSLPQADLRIPVERYYRPLAANAPRATSIFQRMANVACHPDMAAFEDHEIVSALEKLQTASCSMNRVTEK